MIITKKTRQIKRVHTQLLTATVLKKSKFLDEHNKRRFEIWKRNRKIEFLPERIPYKVSNVYAVRIRQATYVHGVDKPLILVSDLLSRTERQEAAKHELVEWTSRSRKSESEAHNDAVSKERPGTRTETQICHKWYIKQVNQLDIKRAERLTRADYLKWRDSKEIVKIHGKRKV